MKIKLFLLAITICFVVSVKAQGFTLPAKGYYIQASYALLDYNRIHDSTGNVVDVYSNISDKTAQLFAQYGLTKNITLQLKIPYKFISATEDITAVNQPFSIPDGNLNHFGNIVFGGIYAVKKSNPRVNASVMVEANTSDYNYIKYLKTGFNSWGFKPGIAVSQSFDKSWITVDAALDIRTNNYSHSFLSNLEIGYKPTDFVFIAGDIQIKKSVSEGSYCDCTIAHTALYLNNQEYVAFGIKSGFIINDKIGFNFSYTSALSAKNAPASNVVSAGISLQKNN